MVTPDGAGWPSTRSLVSIGGAVIASTSRSSTFVVTTDHPFIGWRIPVDARFGETSVPTRSADTVSRKSAATSLSIFVLSPSSAHRVQGYDRHDTLRSTVTLLTLRSGNSMTLPIRLTS
jgi:hypothetical protein